MGILDILSVIALVLTIANNLFDLTSKIVRFVIAVLKKKNRD